MRFLRCAAPFTLVAFAIAPPAAAREVYGHGPILGAVTAVNLYGNGSFTAPSRNAPVGYQVRLPHGTWVYCRTAPRRPCAFKPSICLRANRMGGYGTLQQKCGVLGCLHESLTVPF